MKSQAVADFLVECPAAPGDEGMGGGDREVNQVRPEEFCWVLHTDGSSNSKGAGLEIVLYGPEGVVLRKGIRCGFRITNNGAEYEALIAGLQLALNVGARKLEVRCDSQLIINQVNGEFQTKHDSMRAYAAIVEQLKPRFRSLSFKQVGRECNKEADALAQLSAITPLNAELDIQIGYAAKPLVEERQINDIAEEPKGSGDPEQRDLTKQPDQPCAEWYRQIVDYLETGQLPEDRTEARRLKVRAARYTMLEGILYRRSFGGPYLRCLEPEDQRYVLAEIHEGQCGNHSGGKAMAATVRRAGYYWPTLVRDAEEYVRACDRCQRFANSNHMPVESLKPITAPWPFMKWGLDIVGKLPVAPGGRVFLLVATDYFTKWIEAEPLAQVKENDIRKFIWKNIICRFGVPKEVVTDNGSQFVGRKVEAFLAEWKIRHVKSTPRYPQSNGQAEASNKVVLNTLKKRLSSHKGAWAEELNGVLWSYRTTARSSTGETPFSLTYGAEAMVPAEVGCPTLRRWILSEEENAARLIESLDAVEEKRLQAAAKVRLYQERLARYYNKKIKCRGFKAGDLVLRAIFQNTEEPGVGKLGPTWEGPYIISRAAGHGAYYLREIHGAEIKNPWNALYLRSYFPSG